MTEQIDRRKNKLIEQVFPWGKDGHPGDLSRNRRRQHVLGHLERGTGPARATAVALLALLRPLAEELRSNLRGHEASRFLHRFDTSHIVKSPESILEKMARKWKSIEGPPPVDFENFGTAFSDLGRFRIVVNFLSDMDLFKLRLEEAFDPRTRARLGLAQTNLKKQFSLDNNCLEDALNVSPDKRNKGERCFKGVFRPRGKVSGSAIEVQIVTVLQEAWDKKDHYLIYEPRRVGIPVDPAHEIEMFSMSELLYIADLTFDRLKTKVEMSRGGDE